MEGDALNRKENSQNDAVKSPPKLNFCGESSKEIAPPRKQRVGVAVALPPALAEPLSPCSSSTSGDATFEPTIEMMVNDFDDEQTLNEEENLAAQEEEPRDEIATLKEESEMPLEELLAKYGATAKISSSRKKMKKTKTKRAKHHHPEDGAEQEATIDNNTAEAVGNADVIVIESGDEELGHADQKVTDGDGNETDAGTEVSSTTVTTEENNGPMFMRPTNKRKHRSRLCDLYPEENFTTTRSEVGKGVAPDIHYYEEEEEEYDEEAEADGDEVDNEYIKKTIMVGSAYQAVIPDGLSQYGDVLPYENEDQLIWEPSQVSEREVESYLECYLKARDTRASSDDDDQMSAKDAKVAATACLPEEGAKSTLLPALNNKNSDTVSGSEAETAGVIKDNEQALHLLVQCGYDFKEALRRKQLNAVPPTGAMSLWSEEECLKFEEGIQKFGKDFVMIRQHQVRTRTMRELVQFYYLWKKSQRRDIDFANSDTVDHMDIYLNEGKDYGPNTVSTTVLGLPTSTTPTFAARKSSGGIQKNFSIMSSAASAVVSPPLNSANAKPSTNKKRTVGNATSSLLTATSTFSK